MAFKVIGAWTAPDNEQAFEEHYWRVHIPLAAAVPKLIELRSTRVHGFGDSPGPCYRLAEMFFVSEAEMTESATSPEWAAMAADSQLIMDTFGVVLTGGFGSEDELD